MYWRHNIIMLIIGYVLDLDSIIRFKKSIAQCSVEHELKDYQTIAGDNKDVKSKLNH